VLTSSCIVPLPERREDKLMGLTHVTVRIANPADSQRRRDIEFLVDSGAIYTVVPKKILEELGISPHSKRFFLLANGEKFERLIGSVDVIYKKRHGAATVVFGEKGDFPLLGVTALEALGLIFDPLQRKLKPVALTM
jgi:clan AA aspartic protease